MRPCLGIVILVGAVEVPGAADLLVCGQAEWGGGILSNAGGEVGWGGVGGCAACGIV